MQHADTLTATLILDTRELVPDRHVIDVTVGASGEVIVLSSERSIREFEQREVRGRIYSIAMATAGPHRYQIHRVTAISTNVTELPDTESLVLRAQALDADHWLLVHGKANQRLGEEASIVTSAGQYVNSFEIGDGIEQVATSADGHIWVSYFDEGVFSQNGIGQAGMLCFDQSGHTVLRFLDIARQYELPTIDDCYALNVGDNGEVWLYYYSEFPLVRLRNGQFDHIWRNVPVAGSRGFAIKDEMALLTGGYQARDRLFEVALDL